LTPDKPSDRTYRREFVVGAPAWLGDADGPGLGLPDDGDGLPDDGDGEPDDGEGEPDDGDGEPDDGDADDGGGEPDSGGGDPDGGGVVAFVGNGGGGLLGGDWLNIRIAMSIASIAMRIISNHEARIEILPARS
jgi:hypothetical protein